MTNALPGSWACYVAGDFPRRLTGGSQALLNRSLKERVFFRLQCNFSSATDDRIAITRIEVGAQHGQSLCFFEYRVPISHKPDNSEAPVPLERVGPSVSIEVLPYAGSEVSLGRVCEEDSVPVRDQLRESHLRIVSPICSLCESNSKMSSLNKAAAAGLIVVAQPVEESREMEVRQLEDSIEFDLRRAREKKLKLSPG